MSAHPYKAGDRFRVVPRGDRYDGLLGVVREIWTSASGEHYVHAWTDDGSYTMWPVVRLEHADEPHSADCLCYPCDDARWGLAPAVEAPMPHDDEHGRDVAQEPAYGDRILAIGLWSDAEAFALAEAANAAAAEGRDPGQAVQDLVQAWDAGEVPA